jgi:hypothetical protein
MSGGGAEEAAGAGPAERRLIVAGEEWIVRSGGTGAAGTGSEGLAIVEAIHFYRSGELRPRFEALIARGRWTDLFDEELAALLGSAVPVAPPLE